VFWKQNFIAYKFYFLFLKGEEIGMVDYRDFEIKDSRDPNRTPMQWNNNAGAGCVFYFKFCILSI